MPKQCKEVKCLKTIQENIPLSDKTGKTFLIDWLEMNCSDTIVINTSTTESNRDTKKSSMIT